jgi:DNA-binding NtrC family response regulator
LPEKVRSLPQSGRRAILVGSSEGESIRHLLESAAFLVEDVASTEAAIRKRNYEGPFDVVVWETASSEHVFDELARLCAAFAGAAIVCIERSGDKARAGSLLAQGADDVVLRPVRHDELSVRVRRAIERRTLIAEAQHARDMARTPADGVADFADFREPERSSQTFRVARPADAIHGKSLREMVDAYERTVLEEMLARTGGNKTRAAKELRLTRQGLALKLSKYRR